jgi:hypothetical protein
MQLQSRAAPFVDHVRSMPVPDIQLTIDSDSVLLQAPGLVQAVLPSAYSQVDEDGLTVLRPEWINRNGMVSFEKFFLVPSRYFRPSFGLPNAPNRELLSSLGRLAKNATACEVRLAVDPDRLGILDSFKPMLQRDYWWGPPYTGNPRSQRHGMTVHGPTRYDHFNGLKRTEFWWYGKAESTLEIEEIHNLVFRLDRERLAHGMRFIHSIFDRNDLPRHLDGAVRLYDADLWNQRVQSKLSDFGKKARRMKLWRVDGSLALNDWYELIHMFFRGNYTIAEYFGLPSPDEYRLKAEKASESTSKAV